PDGADGGPHRRLAAAVIAGGETESPPAGLAGDGRLPVVFGVDVEAGGGVDPAVVRAAGPRAVLVDRAAPVDEHRTVPALVVAEQDFALRPARRREQQLRWNAGQRV